MGMRQYEASGAQERNEQTEKNIREGGAGPTTTMEEILRGLRGPLGELVRHGRNTGAGPDVLNRLCDEWVKLTGEWL